MLTLEDYGVCLCEQKITPGNTATGFSANCLQYWEYTFTFNSGSAEPAVGGWLIGATSAAQARVVSVTLASGTWGGGNAVGTIRVASVSGTFNGTENISYIATADALTMTSTLKACPEEYTYKGLMAKSVLFECLGNTALISISPATPNQTALIGIPLAAGSSMVLSNAGNIKNFKVMDYTAGSACVIRAQFYF